MKHSIRQAMGLAIVLAAIAVGSGCSHLKAFGGITPPGSPTPTPTGSASPPPTSCPATPNPAAVTIPMSSSFTASTSSYGIVSGYGPPNSSEVSGPSQPIEIRPGDTIQFFNSESANLGVATHSAASLNTSHFPTPPFAFPTPEQSPLGSTIGSSTQQWSTGRIPATDGSGNACFSQTFQVTAANGTLVYFGDLDFYNSANARDVLVVTSSAPQSRRRGGPP